ncbi:prostatic acid phosphatase-like [Neodiprion virginianus]|uniref:prostatic acid phosphatase-like n=1 Tax=Neodiprion virginianus TaxID=2961670 RepID=UPI001EE6E727|nr:prostatic acid phosphatase-like [Neodiprion virginianus]XP_046617070.1 prostatic acid phosphatase-like [Neodiprion virginianus]XP_046617071.1 prostatic acid phosphatase-like [Neodiprion virginianus]
MRTVEAVVAVVTTCIVFGASSAYSKNVDLGTIVFANILFRHGDRTPVDPYPTDPWGNETLWPVPFGQLTNVGKSQHLRLGRWFRERYSHLLPECYTPYDVYVQSTDIDRTLMSAEANLAGLYPPEGDQVWDKLKWMPIPVHTIPELEDSLLASKKYCPKYEMELQNVMNSPEIRKIDDDNQELYNYLSKKAGTMVQSVSDVSGIYNTLFIEVLYNRTLPEWTKSVYPDKLKPLADFSFTVEAHNKLLQRLKSGRLLGEMVDHLVSKSKNALFPNRKIWIYSAHDTTVANFLMTLDLFEPHCPPYTATVLVELRVNSLKQYIVTISYKNTSAEPRLLTLPGCEVACPLGKFVELTNDMIPKDWAKECLLGWEQYAHNITMPSIFGISILLLVIIVLLGLLIIGVAYYHRNCDSNRYYFKLTTDPI